jgi:hypothetical protein
VALLPVSRYLVLCDAVIVDPQNPLRVNLLGVVSAYRSVAIPPFPVRRPEFAVYTQFSDCHGPVSGHLRVVRGDNFERVAMTPDRVFPLPHNPLEVVGISYLVRNCTFPVAGLYWVQLWCEGKLLQEAPLNVR